LLKTADFARQRRAYSQQNNGDYYEYLLLDEQGYILEGTGSNFYAVRDGVVYTAESASWPALPGALFSTCCPN
jgi:branched-chain amino acid aminotransferase